MMLVDVIAFISFKKFIMSAKEVEVNTFSGADLHFEKYSARSGDFDKYYLAEEFGITQKVKREHPAVGCYILYSL